MPRAPGPITPVDGGPSDASSWTSTARVVIDAAMGAPRGASAITGSDRRGSRTHQVARALDATAPGRGPACTARSTRTGARGDRCAARCSGVGYRSRSSAWRRSSRTTASRSGRRWSASSTRWRPSRTHFHPAMRRRRGMVERRRQRERATARHRGSARARGVTLRRVIDDIRPMDAGALDGPGGIGPVDRQRVHAASSTTSTSPTRRRGNLLNGAGGRDGGIRLRLPLPGCGCSAPAPARRPRRDARGTSSRATRRRRRAHPRPRSTTPRRRAAGGTDGSTTECYRHADAPSHWLSPDRYGRPPSTGAADLAGLRRPCASRRSRVYDQRSIGSCVAGPRVRGGILAHRGAATRQAPRSHSAGYRARRAMDPRTATPARSSRTASRCCAAALGSPGASSPNRFQRFELHGAASGPRARRPARRVRGAARARSRDGVLGARVRAPVVVGVRVTDQWDRLAGGPSRDPDATSPGSRGLPRGLLARGRSRRVRVRSSWSPWGTTRRRGSRRRGSRSRSAAELHAPRDPPCARGTSFRRRGGPEVRPDPRPAGR